jgi:hypothetical protein
VESSDGSDNSMCSDDEGKVVVEMEILSLAILILFCFSIET